GAARSFAWLPDPAAQSAGPGPRYGSIQLRVLSAADLAAQLLFLGAAHRPAAFSSLYQRALAVCGADGFFGGGRRGCADPTRVECKPCAANGAGVRDCI